MLTGIQVKNIESAKEAAQKISDRGVETVIITLGVNGALILHQDNFTHVPAVPVKAIDTTAAGDVFNGALAISLAESDDIIAATTLACKASAISVTRMGAQSSVPFKKEVDGVRR